MHVLEVLQKIEYEEALPDGDPRYVDTQQARGSERTFARLARKFGWDPATDAFFAPNDKHVLFFGHIGSGKTTELRRYAGKLNDSKRFYVVEVDVLAKLDRNNLQYTEALMAMAETLLERLHADGHPLDDDALQPMRDWFTSAIHTRSTNRDLSAELRTGVQTGGGIPGIVKLFAGFTAAFKTGSSQKSEWRQEIRNGFTTLAVAFSNLIRHAEAALARAGRAQRVLFLVDGTDKMRGEDTQQFFVQDAEQLLAIQTLAIYTAPLHLKYDGRLGGKLDADMVLPMIKLQERDGSPFAPGLTAMHELLLRLLKLCCEVADDKIDAAVVQRAIEQLASDYRYFLKPSDYVLLKAIDTNPAHSGNDVQAQDLLHRLALLQYNDGTWRRSHPVVRTLEGYQLAPAPAA